MRKTQCTRCVAGRPPRDRKPAYWRVGVAEAACRWHVSKAVEDYVRDWGDEPVVTPLRRTVNVRVVGNVL